MKRAPIEVGQVVVSMAGRDEGRWFLVLALPDAEYALVADGRLRKVEKPKKKKVMHLRSTGEMIAELQRRLQAGERVRCSITRYAKA